MQPEPKEDCAMRAVKYRSLCFRTPCEMADAIERAAQRDLLSLSDFIRGAVLAKLRADGLLVDQPARS
jgi:hypothetical protein